MGLTLADSYYLKAANGVYYSDWDEVCEALNYALSYDEEHCASLCLLGDVYAKNLSMFEKAFECFDKVIAINSNYADVYPMYIKYAIQSTDLKKAKTLLQFAKTIKTIDVSQIHWLSAYQNEVLGRYKQSLKHLKVAKTHCYNENYFSFLEEERTRIKHKIKLSTAKKCTKDKKVKRRKKNRK